MLGYVYIFTAIIGLVVAFESFLIYKDSSLIKLLINILIKIRALAFLLPILWQELKRAVRINWARCINEARQNI